MTIKYINKKLLRILYLDRIKKYQKKVLHIYLELLEILIFLNLNTCIFNRSNFIKRINTTLNV